ncbi:MAG: nucleotidyltransferase family protein [Pseudomonadota bacterium]
MSSAAPTSIEIKPRMDAAAKLAVFVSRSELPTSARVTIQSLAQQIHCWDAFVDITFRKFASGFAHKHLKIHAADHVPETVMERLSAMTSLRALASLRVLGTQLRFHKTCIASTGADYAYVKGPTLAKQSKINLNNRFSRDVDVLVARRHLRKILNAAKAAGYLFRLQDDQDPELPSSKDIHFLSKYADVVTLFDTSGVPIEVHTRLDKLSLNFTLERAKQLGSFVDVSLPGATVKTFSPTLHFTYICYHHSRHFWSKLHWLADIDALQRLPEFDAVEANRIAEAIGIGPSIKASLEFTSLISNPTQWSEKDLQRTGGGQFLKACLMNLDGDLEREEKLRETMQLSDFMSAWQVSSGRYSGFWRESWLRRIRPSVTQYVENRYPRGFYWVYSVRNAIQLAQNGFNLILRSNKKTTARSQNDGQATVSH